MNYGTYLFLFAIFAGVIKSTDIQVVHPQNRTGTFPPVMVLTDPNPIGESLFAGCWPLRTVRANSEQFYEEALPTIFPSFCQYLKKDSNIFLINIGKRFIEIEFQEEEAPNIIIGFTFPITKYKISRNGQEKWEFNSTSEYSDNERINIPDDVEISRDFFSTNLVKNNLQIRTINGQDFAFFADAVFNNGNGGMAVVLLDDLNTQTIQLYFGQNPNVELGSEDDDDDDGYIFGFTFSCSNQHCVILDRGYGTEVTRINGTNRLEFVDFITDTSNGWFVQISDNGQLIAVSKMDLLLSDGSVKIVEFDGTNTFTPKQELIIVKDGRVEYIDVQASSLFRIQSLLFFKSFFAVGVIGSGQILDGDLLFGNVFIYRVDELEKFDIEFIIAPSMDLIGSLLGTILTVVDDRLMVIGTGTFSFHSLLVSSLNCPTLHNCAVCEDSVRCDLCSLGFFLEDNKCTPCVEDCLRCNATTCFQCIEGKHPANDRCVTCRDILRCIGNCDPTDGTCQSCYDGFFVDLNGTKCSECIKDCSLCYNENECEICDYGFFDDLDGTKCSECIENCKICSNENECEICDDGFDLDISDKCIDGGENFGTKIGTGLIHLVAVATFLI